MRRSLISYLVTLLIVFVLSGIYVFDAPVDILRLPVEDLLFFSVTCSFCSTIGWGFATLLMKKNARLNSDVAAFFAISVSVAVLVMVSLVSVLTKFVMAT